MSGRSLGSDQDEGEKRKKMADATQAGENVREIM